MKILKQKRLINDYEYEKRQRKSSDNEVQRDVEIGKMQPQIVDHVKKSHLNSEDHVQQLLHENENLQKQVEHLQLCSSKRNKSVNYYKRSLKKVKSKFKTEIHGEVKSLKDTILNKDKEIQSLLSEINELEEKLRDNVNTKNADGSYSDSAQLCVIELAGLEVAVEKIPKVVQVVSSHLFARHLNFLIYHQSRQHRLSLMKDIILPKNLLRKGLNHLQVLA
ncbi:hypothetical protein DPMN_102511 [Dreissena polymorpha]|uniref:Uncharacterized protein n=1 Tax=Dreissena polymorpha TaxID=45954 RepID=A0A9D4LN14_DREPO|nr:hypothetical protein DPMN_102511 [Dreissena polymorpha]